MGGKLHDEAMLGAPQAPPSRLVLLGLGALLGVFLVATASASSRAAVLTLGLLGGMAGLGAIARFAPERACDALYLLFVALVAIPVDAYLGYREHVGGWPGVRIAASDVSLVLLVPLAILGAFLGRIQNGIPRRVLLFAGLLLAWYGVAAALSPRRDLALFEIASTLHAFLVAWILAAFFRRELLPWILALVALQVLVHSSFAVAQGITGRPIGAGILGGANELLQEALSGGETQPRPAGLFAHPIVYATSLVITLPLVTAGLAAVRSSALRGLFAVSLAVGLVGLVLSLSRGAWIAAVSSFVLLGILGMRCGLLSARRIRTIVAAVLLGALVIGAAFGPRIVDRLVRSDPGNVDVRFDLNAIALRMIAAKPFVGNGLNNFVETMKPFDPKNVMAYFPAPAHNLYLLEAAEAGLPALVFFVGLIGSIVLTAFHHLPRVQERDLQWAAAALLAGIVGFLISALADFSHRLEPLRSMIWVDVGLLFGVLQASHRRRAVREHHARHAAPEVIAPGATQEGA